MDVWEAMVYESASAARETSANSFAANGSSATGDDEDSDPDDEDADYAKECRELVRSLDLEQKVKFLGFQKISDMLPKMGINSIHIVRDAELQTALSDPKVEMIVTIDQDGHDVHPPCKDPLILSIPWSISVRLP